VKAYGAPVTPVKRVTDARGPIREDAAGFRFGPADEVVAEPQRQRGVRRVPQPLRHSLGSRTIR
jgi:hypothetical protein